MASSNPYESSSTVPSDGPVVLEHKGTAMASWFAILAAASTQAMLTCACGHLDLFTLTINVGALAFAGLAYSKPSLELSLN